VDFLVLVIVWWYSFQVDAVLIIEILIKFLEAMP